MFRKTWLPLVLITVVFGFSACSPSHKLCNFALKKDGKVYMYSMMGQFIVEHQLEQGETPTIMPQRSLVLIDGDYYIDASQMEHVVNVLSGNYKLYPKQEPSFDGYLAAGKHEVHHKKYTQRATENIGTMANEVRVTLKDTSGSKEMLIRWQRQPEIEALENCEVHQLKMDRSYAPGEQVITLEDGVVVPLQTLIDFYDPRIEAEYDSEQDMVYFIVP